MRENKFRVYYETEKYPEGQEIHEGDIVKKDREIITVEWYEQEIGWRLYQGFIYKISPQIGNCPLEDK